MTSNEENFRENWWKIAISFVVCLLVRLIPFRVPNIEPIMTATMPFSKAYGASLGFFFAFLSIIFYDLVTGTLGKWTLLTSVSYGIIGFASAHYFKNRSANKSNFVFFAVIGTLFFDLITLFTGPLFFHQPVMMAIIGQIPFTLLHLAGNITFAMILSPAIYSFAIKKKPARNAFSIADAGGKIDIAFPISILNPKII